ncbi:META domain-containing protein [Sandarakinorhabdus rubra]|uniref:META domain-containing protein n=1 Tax=Sandarakinorhabdus rubra TaxID=2672568 RepID=UPI0013DA6F52|nr:META domain-containing protein [Sandarakinorhabdus rubra]
MRAVLPAVLLLGLMTGCHEQRAQLGHALSGQPPVIAGTLEGEWVLADLNGGGVPEAGISLRFDPGDQNTSRVSGKSGCNQFTGDWRQTGAALKLGPLASTMMACPAPVMAVEQRFLAVLGAVTSVTYTQGGEAILSAPDGRRLRLRRPPKSAQ